MNTETPSVRAFAPGRIEILGNHTDYNDGYVLSMAIDLGITATLKSRSDRNLQLHSEESDDGVMTPLDGEIAATKTWADYSLGVVKQLLARGVPVAGCDILYTSDLPQGAGLSSSAALEVSTAVGLTALAGGSTLSKLDLAKLCRAAENDFVGVGCGLLDQVSSLFGEESHAIFLDCRKETVETIPMPEEYRWLVISSAVPHALTGGEYNERREQCQEAARLLGVPALRDAKIIMLGSTELPDVVRRRAMHIVGENERVQEGIDFLRRGAMQDFGALMFASHESSRTNFENSTPELDQLVEIAKKTPGICGARLTGGGFGGAILCLAKVDQAETAGWSIAEQYKEQTGHVTVPIICKSGAGARVLR
ncbi:MAG: galactokinase [Chthoniobacterales bacterium]